MISKRITVKGKKQNLYKITILNGINTVSQIKKGLMLDTIKKVGVTYRFEDALNLVRSYSGREVVEVVNW